MQWDAIKAGICLVSLLYCLVTVYVIPQIDRI